MPKYSTVVLMMQRLTMEPQTTLYNSNPTSSLAGCPARTRNRANQAPAPVFSARFITSSKPALFRCFSSLPVPGIAYRVPLVRVAWKVFTLFSGTGLYLPNVSEGATLNSELDTNHELLRSLRHLASLLGKNSHLAPHELDSPRSIEL